MIIEKIIEGNKTFNNALSFVCDMDIYKAIKDQTIVLNNKGTIIFSPADPT